ncbi:MAG: cation diffusion facilitator family transporter, partial [Sciscionella sp.]
MKGHRDKVPAGSYRQRLRLALGVAGAVLVAEALGAYFAGSLALAADAGHMFTDVFALSLSLAALTASAHVRGKNSTFGMYRLEILAAVVNALILLGVAAFVVWSAIGRLAHPPVVDSSLMLGVGLLGVLGNSFSLRWLHPAHRENLNVRGAYLEVVADLLGSVGVVLAALIIMTTGWSIADPAISLL